VRKRGYRVWSMPLEVAAGQTLTLPPVTLVPEEAVAAGPNPTADTNGTATPIPTPPTTAAAGFSLTSDPAGATVFVDGRERGTTPVTLSDLAAGPRQVRVVATGRLPWESTINVVAGSILPLATVSLAPAVTVSFTSEPSGAEVTLVRGSTRERVGTTPCETSVDPSADWTVEMQSTGYRTWTRDLRIRSGATTHEVEATLAEERVAVVSMRERPVQVSTMDPSASTMEDEPVTPPAMTEAGGSGTLRINSRPWSQVFVDGRLIGNTPQMNISLSAGRHQVTLVNPDFNVRHTISVNVVAGETVTRIEDLPMQ
jgi:hypothetical protein